MSNKFLTPAIKTTGTNKKGTLTRNQIGKDETNPPGLEDDTFEEPDIYGSAAPINGKKAQIISKSMRNPSKDTTVSNDI